jgi:mycothiol synthase
VRAADLTLRPATVDDAAFAADLETAVHPDEPRDPVEYAHYWRNPDTNVKIERFVGELDGRPVAYAFHEHAVWETPERFGRVGADVLPAVRTPERVDALFAAVEERSRADGTRRFTAWTWEYDGLRLGVLGARGFREERRERFWELDLAANRPKLEAMAKESRAKMSAQGIRVLTIDTDDDPDKWTKLWRMSNEAELDIPTTEPHVLAPFDDFMNQWMRSPGVREDRIWVARQGDAILGVSMLSYPPKRGFVQTDWTGVARAGRGRGIARALKCETVMQAIALGVDRVRTDNDFQNTPILHINETMGYRRRPDMIQLMREA